MNRFLVDLENLPSVRSKLVRDSAHRSDQIQIDVLSLNKILDRFVEITVAGSY